MSTQGSRRLPANLRRAPSSSSSVAFVMTVTLCAPSWTSSEGNNLFSTACSCSMKPTSHAALALTRGRTSPTHFPLAQCTYPDAKLLSFRFLLQEFLHFRFQCQLSFLMSILSSSVRLSSLRSSHREIALAADVTGTHSSFDAPSSTYVGRTQINWDPPRSPGLG